MPLSFETVSHGQIPIGFFNIDTDLFLIDNYFIFANELCANITAWAALETHDLRTELELYIIVNSDDVGNLMGAIYGVVYTGFIGEVYKKFPFPKKKEEFKQKPDGAENRDVVEEILLGFAENSRIKVKINKKSGAIKLGEFEFTKKQFHDVIAYIWRGGMPGWKDDEPPEYVKAMMRAVIDSEHWLFDDDMPMD